MQVRWSRRASWLLAVLWVVAASYYWWTTVVVPPSRVLQLPAGKGFRGFTPNRELVLVSFTPLSGRRQVGPIEFWRFPDLVKVREAFTANDAIDSSRPDALRRIVVIRDDKAWLANFDTGELLEELPGVETKECGKLLHKDRLFWVRDETAYIYDLAAKRVLASYSGLVWIGQTTDTLTTLSSKSYVFRHGWAHRRSTILSTTTGQRDHRFDRQGAMERVQLSPDGRFAAIFTADTLAVCDVPSAKELWSIPRPPVENDEVRFEEQSSVLAMDYLDEHSAPGTARWRVADGSVVSAVPAKSSGALLRIVDQQGRYAIDRRLLTKNWLGDQLERGAREIRRRLGGTNPSWSGHDEFWEVRDLNSDRRLGVYAYEHCSAFFAPDGSSFVAATDDDYLHHQLRYYRLPPGRDWWWLVRWGALPPVVLLALRWMFNVRRRVASDAAQ